MQLMKSLQLKIILMTVLILTVIFGLIFLTINVYIKTIVNKQVSFIFNELVENNGYKKISAKNQFEIQRGNQPPQKEKDIENLPLRKEPPRRDFNEPYFNRDKENLPPNRNSFLDLPFDIHTMRNFFSVELDTKKNVKKYISDFPISYSEEELKEMIDNVLYLDKETGTYNGLRYLLAEKPYGYLLIFIDTRIEQNITFQLFRISVIAYIVSLLCSVGIAFIFSLFAIKPVKKSFDNQKQFIADASHELKTPLAVINANVDVLENEVGTNKWLENIHNDIDRMNELIKSLLYLSKVDNHENLFIKKEFCISRAIESIVLSFESLAFENDIQIETNIQDSINYFGDEEQIKECIVILLDNALKYSFPKTTVKVSLFVNNKINIVIRNSGIGIKQEDLRKIFRRFYRVDVSRERESGGYGLGLSIAQSIINQHKGKITAASEYNSWAEFLIQL